MGALVHLEIPCKICPYQSPQSVSFLVQKVQKIFAGVVEKSNAVENSIFQLMQKLD